MKSPMTRDASTGVSTRQVSVELIESSVDNSWISEDPKRMQSSTRKTAPTRQHSYVSYHAVEANSLQGRSWFPLWSRIRDGPWRNRFSGWRGGTLLSIIVCAIVLFVNILIAIVAMASGKPVDGMATTYRGNCDVAARQLTVSHLFINIFSSLLLGASNYCMQRLVAPTRKEIDAAHAKRTWLDIGVPSVRNLFFVARSRVFLWFLLGISSIPLHFVYNSAVIGLTSANVVDFMELNTGISPEINGQMWDRSRFANLTNDECHEAYSAQLISTYGAGWGVIAPDIDSSVTQGDNFTGFGQLGLSKTYSYCISERTRPRCEVQLSLPIIGVVILANAIKLFTIAFILWLHNHETIVTIGDAVQSFLQDPDQTTKDRCLLSTSNIGSQWQTDNSPDVQRWKQRYKPSWHTACSPRRWVVTIIFALAPIVVAATFVGMTQLSRKYSIDKRWNTFGRVSTSHFVNLSRGISGGSVLKVVLVVNAPQFMISVLYLLYNGVFTGMLSAREWTQYAVKRAPLRVTCPLPGQRSTHFLQLPYSWSLPLLTASALLHWYISQSLFLARIAFYKNGQPSTQEFYQSSSGKWDPISDTSDLEGKARLPLSGNIFNGMGYSDIALVATLSLVLALAIACKIVATCCTFARGLPVNGTNSAVISAACHFMYAQQAEKPDDIAQQPLQWGVTVRGAHDRVGHLCFSCGDVEEPDYDCLYAGVT